jgi:type IV pilus assembly protein PilM
MRDGEVADPIALADAIKALFAEHDLPKTVRLGIAHQRIVVRTLDLEATLDDPKALSAAVKAAAPDHIPMPMDEAVLDFQPLGVVNTPLGLRSRVVVVAVRREMVERAAAGGIETIASGLAERRGLTLEHARAWMSHVGLAAPLDGIDGDPDLVEATRSALEDGVRELADSIRTSLNFYRTQDSAETVELGVVTGAAVGIPGFVERLSEQLRLPLEARVIAGPEDVDAGRLTVAAGLAIAERA